MMMVLPRMPDGMFSITTRTNVLQSLKAFIRHCIIMQLKVQLIRIMRMNVHKGPVWTERTLRRVPAEILLCRCARTFANRAMDRKLRSAALATRSSVPGFTSDNASRAPLTLGAEKRWSAVMVGAVGSLRQNVVTRRGHYRRARTRQEVFESLSGIIRFSQKAGSVKKVKNIRSSKCHVCLLWGT